jgi:hypothetical protein
MIDWHWQYLNDGWVPRLDVQLAGKSFSARDSIFSSEDLYSGASNLERGGFGPAISLLLSKLKKKFVCGRLYLEIILSTFYPRLSVSISKMAPPAKDENPVRLWGGRFTGEIDPLMNQYNESLSIDRVFYAQDIKGSIAYARANVKTGILTQPEFEKLEVGLKEILKEWDEDRFQPAPGDEGEQVVERMPFVHPSSWALSVCRSSGQATISK